MHHDVLSDRKPLPSQTFLARLRRNKAGNTLMLVGMSIIPLVAMIGAGVDVSRTYMIKSRLQQACDAGALAVRKSMAGGSSLSGAPTTNGQNFFNNNFPSGAFGTTNIGFSASLSADAQVMATATARVPMTVMTVFGNNYTDVSVHCDAKLEVANTDVMFVLDVTGSMADCPDNSSCGGGSGSKIVGLRQAVVDFYDTIGAASSATSQIRFGFVPYSTTVNVGALLPASYFKSTHTYQSAVANMTTPYYEPSPQTPTVTTETYGSSISSSNCNSYGSNKSYPSFDGAIFNTGGPSPATTTRTTYAFKDWGVVNDVSGTNRTCRRTKTVQNTTYPQLGFSLTDWTFRPVDYDVSDFKGGASVSIAESDPTGYMPTSGSYNLRQLAAQPLAGTSNNSYAWNNCIEERDTVASATFSPIPGGAFDLEIDSIPSSDATRWRTQFQEIIRDRGGIPNENQASLSDNSNPNGPCPYASAKLAVLSRASVQSYVNALIPTGNTYHDIGMVWGARLISPTGMFSGENAAAANGRPISRHIIFMTDGAMCPNPNVYTFQGYEKLDRRVMGTTSPGNCTGEIINRHNNRFLALCAAAKSMNISVWTVAFGTSNPPTLINCANANQAFVATNTAALRTQFQQIAARIASLRLSR
jgi:Flp pilus assembly protein TadG